MPDGQSLAPVDAVQGTVAGVWAANSDLLHWRELDGDWLVHDAGSCQVHLLDTLTAAVLDQLQVAPADAARLLAWAAQSTGESDAVALAAAVHAALDKLRLAGLIEAVLP